VVVVEHDPEIIKQADFIVDLGPQAGEKGGEVIFQGRLGDFLNCSTSLTASYLTRQTLAAANLKAISSSIKPANTTSKTLISGFPCMFSPVLPGFPVPVKVLFSVMFFTKE